MGVYEIRFARDIVKDLQRVPAFHRVRIVSAIEGQLGQTPRVATRNRKPLVNLIPPWPADPPVWELRVGTYRVFYDVDEEQKVVSVRAVRRKAGGRTTGEIL
jgi:mRNA-degrading endonuclease RelE of RelBE toxin-antitoxin system